MAFGGGLTGSLAALRSDVLRARRETRQTRAVTTRVNLVRAESRELL
jgi:hypothetical protein